MRVTCYWRHSKLKLSTDLLLTLLNVRVSSSCDGHLLLPHLLFGESVKLKVDFEMRVFLISKEESKTMGILAKYLVPDAGRNCFLISITNYLMNSS